MLRLFTGVWFGVWCTLAIKHIGVPTLPSQMFYWYDAASVIIFVVVSIMLGAGCCHEHYYKEKF